jgi:hypothetical protein
MENNRSIWKPGLAQEAVKFKVLNRIEKATIDKGHKSKKMDKILKMVEAELGGKEISNEEDRAHSNNAMPVSKKRTQQNTVAMSEVERAQDICPMPNRAQSESAMPKVVAHSRNAMPNSRAQSESAMPSEVAHSRNAMPKSRAHSESAMPKLGAHSRNAMPRSKAHSDNAMPESKAQSKSAMPGSKAHSDSAMPKSRAQSNSDRPIKINYKNKRENSNLNYRKVQLRDNRGKEKGKCDWICSDTEGLVRKRAKLLSFRVLISSTITASSARGRRGDRHIRWALNSGSDITKDRLWGSWREIWEDRGWQLLQRAERWGAPRKRWRDEWRAKHWMLSETRVSRRNGERSRHTCTRLVGRRGGRISRQMTCPNGSCAVFTERRGHGSQPLRDSSTKTEVRGRRESSSNRPENPCSLIPLMGTKACESPSDHEASGPISKPMETSRCHWIVVELAQQHHKKILHCCTFRLTKQAISIHMIVNKISKGKNKASHKPIDHEIESRSNWHKEEEEKYYKKGTPTQSTTLATMGGFDTSNTALKKTAYFNYRTLCKHGSHYSYYSGNLDNYDYYLGRIYEYYTQNHRRVKLSGCTLKPENEKMEKIRTRCVTKKYLKYKTQVPRDKFEYAMANEISKPIFILVAQKLRKPSLDLQFYLLEETRSVKRTRNAHYCDKSLSSLSQNNFAKKNLTVMIALTGCFMTWMKLEN